MIPSTRVTAPLPGCGVLRLSEGGEGVVAATGGEGGGLVEEGGDGAFRISFVFDDEGW
jgi:hypothetical protein